jgi:hypothetical protein
MKQTVFFCIATLLSFSSIAQEVYVTSFHLEDSYPRIENGQRMSFELAVITDISTFTYNFDPDKTVYTKIMDDTGFDLLSAQKKYEQKSEETGYGNIRLKINYRSPIESNEIKGIKVSSTLAVIPKPGANMVSVKGVIAMINVADSEQKYTLKDIPTKSDWGPGVQTEIGEVKITEAGSYEVDGGISFTKYQVRSGQPIVSMTISGGDDREEAEKYFKLGLYGDEMIFKSIPEKLELVVVAKDTEIKEIPFEIDLKVGF